MTAKPKKGNCNHAKQGVLLTAKSKSPETREPAPLLKELEPFFREVMAPDAVATPSFTAATAIRGISVTVLVVATAVETALPAMALSSPIISRMALQASIRFSSAMVTEKSAALSGGR